MLSSQVTWPLPDKLGQFRTLPVLSLPKARCTPGPRELQAWGTVAIARCPLHGSSWRGRHRSQGLATWPSCSGTPLPTPAHLRSGDPTSFRVKVAPLSCGKAFPLTNKKPFPPQVSLRTFSLSGGGGSAALLPPAAGLPPWPGRHLSPSPAALPVP